MQVQLGNAWTNHEGPVVFAKDRRESWHSRNSMVEGQLQKAGSSVCCIRREMLHGFTWHIPRVLDIFGAKINVKIWWFSSRSDAKDHGWWPNPSVHRLPGVALWDLERVQGSISEACLLESCIFDNKFWLVVCIVQSHKASYEVLALAVSRLSDIVKPTEFWCQNDHSVWNCFKSI